jgi:hypothetical protein
LLNLCYGPINPQFGHLYVLLNSRHFEQRQITISPQFGHENFVAILPGETILLHDVHIGIFISLDSLNIHTSEETS